MVASLCCVENNQNEIQALNETEIDELDDFSCIDLYLIGRIWIDALRTCLVGANFNLFPVVNAANVDETPKKPPYMKYQDLSLYRSPHCEYKTYIDDKKKCPDANVKLLHRSLLPYVKDGRQTFNTYLCKTFCAIKTNARNAGDAVNKSKNNFKQNMRDPDNLAVRQAVVTSGGVLGYMVGGGGGIPRRLFYTSAGLLTTGALCFPKETDEAFRNVTFVLGKTFLALYNKWCGKNFNLREKLACRDELPAQPPQRQPLKCPPK